MKTSKPLFEHVACSRCGGSGTFSFNAMHGSVCYGCRGSGCQLTKRGHAAQAFLDALRTRPLGEVKVGDLVRFETMNSRLFARVESIEPDPLNGGGRIVVRAKHPTKESQTVGLNAFANTPVQMGFTAEEKQEQRRLALEYQATLTKQGKPAKRAA